MKKLILCFIAIPLAVLLLMACNSRSVYQPEADGYVLTDKAEIKAEIEIEAEIEADEDKDANAYERSEVDFIFMTNGSGDVEPVELREGDSFLGLTLEILSHSEIFTRNNQFYSGWGVAEFSGEIVVRGDLVLWGSEWRSGIMKHDFFAHELYRGRFPMIVNGWGGGTWFHIENEEDLLALLGVSHYTQENNKGTRFEDIVIRINNYTIVSVDAGVNDTAEIVDVVAWWNGELPIKFNTLPNGTKVDARVDDEVVDLIFRHFEAIENGDVVAFRETLQGQDGISANNHISQILSHFWDIVIGDYEDEMFWGDLYIDLTRFGSDRVFHEEFPAVSRNMGLRIVEIRNSYGHWGHGVVVTVVDNNQEEAVYILHLLSDFGWVGVDLRFRLE